MKTRARVAAATALVAVAALLAPAPAQAHYDPWRTHWHYSYIDGSRTYKMCSWIDAMLGCRSGY